MKRATLLAVLFAFSGAAAAADTCAKGEAKTITVKGKNDEWTDSGLKIEAGDLVVVKAEGEVLIGSWAGKVNANGQNNHVDGLGRLTMKVGETGLERIGKRGFVEGDGELVGAIKFKVHDKKYEDNDGAFTVTVTRIPACAIPKP